MHNFRRYFIAGLLIWLPIWVTLLIIGFIIGLFDSIMLVLPKAYQPDTLLRFHLPGLGVIISVLVVFLTGMLVTNFLGRRLVALGEAIVSKIPFVRSIYSAVKQVIETLFSSSGQSFRNVYLVEYPRKGIWSIGFQSGTSAEEISTVTGEELLTLFIPTTPNPTSGFLIMVSAREAIDLKMSVEQALKLVVSLGVIQPSSTLIVEETNK